MDSPSTSVHIALPKRNPEMYVRADSSLTGNAVLSSLSYDQEVKMHIADVHNFEDMSKDLRYRERPWKCEDCCAASYKIR